jgi:hypothetical protein
MTSKPLNELVEAVRAAMRRYDRTRDHVHAGGPRPGDCLRCALKPFEPPKPTPCDACGQNACEPDEVLCPACKHPTGHLLVVYSDEQGLPRAHASGPVSRRREIRKLAFKELEAYVVERRLLGEPINVSDFDRSESVLPEGSP